MKPRTTLDRSIILKACYRLLLVGGLMLFITLQPSAWAEQRWQLDLTHSHKTGRSIAGLDASDHHQQQAQLQAWYQNSISQWQVSFLADQGRSSTLTERLIINEAAFTDSTAHGDWLLGKKALSFSVSYGAKPLALFSQPLSQSLSAEPEQGYGLLIYSQFSDWHERSVLCYSDKVLQRQDYLPQKTERLSQGCGLRFYQLQDEQEWQLLGLFDQHQHWNLGLSALTTLGEAWVLHTEALWRQHSPVWQLQPFAPPIEQSQSSATILVGGTYATASGHQWIAEYWFDGRAWSNTQWHQLDQQRAQLESLTEPAKSQLQRAQTLVFNRAALRQHNLMLHWRYEANGWQPKLDLLLTDDAGWISTLGLQYKAPRAWLASVEWRQFKGDSATVYGQLPIQQQLFARLEYQF